MPKKTSSESEGSSNLADEIRTSERKFVAAAKREIGRLMTMEYSRLRAYAIEGNTDKATISVFITARFGKRFSLSLTTSPGFRPTPMHREIQLPLL